MTPAQVLLTSAAELSTGGKLSTALSKKSGMKREVSPCTHYKRKERGKEAKRDYLRNPVQSRAGAYARVKEPPRTCTPEVAGRVAASIARPAPRGEGAAFLAGMVVGIVGGGCSVFGPGIGASVY